MATQKALIATRLLCLLAFVSGAYCFWLMTVPLSYDLVYVVVGGFIVSVGVFFAAVISSVIIAKRLRRSRLAPPGPKNTPGI